MSLYKEWTDMVVDYVKSKGEDAFWNEYGSIEEKIYINLLSNHKDNITGKVEELANKNDVPLLFYVGFLDGINESLEKQLDFEKLQKDTQIDVKVDFEKLYFNMLEAKADYLYNLPQWDGLFSQEKRKEIHTNWKNSKTVVNENKVGRNDPCPCGSGKKYKKCCGANK